MAKKLSAKQKKLAAFAPPRNKITRADIITAAKTKEKLKATSAGTKKSLAKKAEAARKKGKKVTAGQLGRVYNKGLAAYRTGHRPGTTPSQWAMARVNSVLTGGKAAKVDAHIFGKGKKPKKEAKKKK